MHMRKNLKQFPCRSKIVTQIDLHTRSTESIIWQNDIAKWNNRIHGMQMNATGCECDEWTRQLQKAKKKKQESCVIRIRPRCFAVHSNNKRPKWCTYLNWGCLCACVGVCIVWCKVCVCHSLSIVIQCLCWFAYCQNQLCAGTKLRYKKGKMILKWESCNVDREK